MARMDRYNKPQKTVWRAVFPPEDETPHAPHCAAQEEPFPEDDEEPRVYLPPKRSAGSFAAPGSYGARQNGGTFFEGEGPQGAGEEMPVERGPASPPPRGTAFWAMICFLCVGVLALMGYGLFTVRAAYAPFREMVRATERNTIAYGVTVDDTDIGGLTRAEALQRLQNTGMQPEANLRITLNIDGQVWYLTNEELPFARDLDEVLDMAYAVGRQGSRDTIDSNMTPLEYRYAHRQYALENPIRLYTRSTYDRGRVRELAGIIEANIDREPQDAMVSAFDFNSRSFAFTDDVQGADLDADALAGKIISALDSGDYRAVITMESEKRLPRVTKTALMSTFTLVSTYSTETTSSANRNTNIDLAARAVMGTVVMPGETFSFNQATGQRTTEKGYLPAAAIAGGATVDEVGGGVCQVSSTLFNAAAMADLTILTRFPHTWPSTYVDKGRDATVNWPNLDFQFRNDKQTPVFIVSYYQNRRITVELYGAALEPGVTIELQTRTVSETPPPQEAVYEMNPQLPPGTVQEKKKARTGYEVETYKVYMRNGVEIKRELLCNSTYKMIQQVIEYN